MTLFEILLRTAESELFKQDDSGAMLAGHNGPYCDPETPVRNTAHWLYTFSHLYRVTNDAKWKNASERAIAYLCSDKARPMGATFFCRKNPNKDFSNGVMGQAWVIEALLKAAKVFDREDCYRIAEEVYLLHPWIEENCVWRRVNVDGSYNSMDSTFNHQLWFGAVAGYLNETPEAVSRSKLFFERQATHVHQYRNGVVFHASPLTRFSKYLIDFGVLARKIIQMQSLYRKKHRLWNKSAGYHAFNLYAYSLYKVLYPDHPFWNSEHFSLMISATNSQAFNRALIDNKYSYTYNPTGIELAFTMEVFGFNSDEVTKWLQEQVRHTGEKGESLMTSGSRDPVTSRARIYEATRLSRDYEIEFTLK